MDSEAPILSIKKLKALDIYSLYQDFSDAANNFHFGDNNKNLNCFKEAQRTLRVLRSRSDDYLKKNLSEELASEFDVLRQKGKEFLNSPAVRNDEYMILLDEISDGYDKFVNIVLVVGDENI